MVKFEGEGTFDCVILAFKKIAGVRKMVEHVRNAKVSLPENTVEFRKLLTSGALPENLTEDGCSNWPGAVAIPVMIEEDVWGFFVLSVSGGKSDDKNQEAVLKTLLPSVAAFAKQYRREKLSLHWAYAEKLAEDEYELLWGAAGAAVMVIVDACSAAGIKDYISYALIGDGKPVVYCLLRGNNRQASECDVMRYIEQLGAKRHPQMRLRPK